MTCFFFFLINIGKERKKERILHEDSMLYVLNVWADYLRREKESDYNNLHVCSSS